jgi:hypothetical protein
LILVHRIVCFTWFQRIWCRSPQVHPTAEPMD